MESKNGSGAGTLLILVLVAAAVALGAGLLLGSGDGSDPVQQVVNIIYPATNGADVAIAFGGFATALVIGTTGLGMLALVVVLVRWLLRGLT